MLELIGDLWDNVTSAISSIKDFVLGFTDISTTIFGLIPPPFKEILLVAVVIVVAIVVIKIVRG